MFNSVYKLPIVADRLADDLPDFRRRNYLVKLATREAIIVLCFLVCFIAPSFTDFIGFVGSFQFMLLGVVLPPIVYYYVRRSRMTGLERGGQIIYIVMVIALWVISTVYSLLNLTE